MSKEKIVAAVQELIETFPALDLSFIPPFARGIVNNLIGDENPMQFLSRQMNEIPDDQLPKLIEAARKIVAAADGETKD